MDLRLDLERTRIEVEKLQTDLEVAERNLRESAQQGLALLEAKSELEEQNELLEVQLDKLVVERDLLKEALLKSSHARKEAADIDLEVENDLREEKKQAEDEYTSRIVLLESENRTIKNQTESHREEAKKLQTAVKVITEDNEQLKINHERLHKELLEYRTSEKILSTENEGLHSDNVHLRKHIAVLELRTKEVEGVKFEARKLHDDKELLLCELEECRRLMDIVKQQSDEAWKTLENERELRRTVQRQLHDQTDERERWNRMTSLRLEVEDDDGEYDGSRFVPEISMESGSLFAELKESSTVPDSDFTDRLISYKERLEQIRKISGTLELMTHGDGVSHLPDLITSVASEIRRLCSDNGDTPDRSAFLDDMQTQLSRRTARQTALETEVTGLHGMVEAMCELLSEKQLSLNSCYDSLRSLRSTFSSSSCPVAAGSEPSGPSQDGSSSPTQSSPRRSSTKLDGEIRARIGSSDTIRIPEIVSSIDVAADSDMLMNAFDDLKHQCQELMGTSSAAAGGSARDMKDVNGENIGDLYEQISRLKAHLGRKRDEANLLKEALNNTQISAEKTMASLKSKYEMEKDGSSRMLLQLRKELNQRKEDAATFASIRSMLASRCDDYCTQLENLQRQLRSAEEEKRTLNSLLRMAIQQKLNLIHRVEDLECVLDGQQTQMRRREPARPNRVLFRPRGRASGDARGIPGSR